MKTERKKSGLTVVIMLLFVTVTLTQAQEIKKDPDAEKILNQYVEAIGGEKALAKIKNMVSKSELAFIESGLILDRKIVEDRNNKHFIRVSSPEIGEIIRGFDGNTCWEKRESGIREIEGEEKSSFLNTSAFLRYAEWKKNLAAYEYLGLENMDGIELHRIAVTTIYGAEEIWYFSKNDYFLAQIEEQMKSPKGETKIITVFEDYRDVNGVKHAYNQTIKMPGQTRKISFSSILYNQSIDKNIFSRPAN
jgi:hypothetical protein